MVSVRPEQPGDEAAIHAVHATCFPTADEARLVDALRAAGRLAVSLVAEVGGTVVGHVAFSPVTTAAGAVGAGLAPVAVTAAYRRQGVAAELVRAGLRACRDSGFGWAVVLGEPAYYARFGFRPAAAVGLADEYGGGPAFQAVELVADALPVGGGLVRYAPEFAALGPTAPPDDEEADWLAAADWGRMLDRVRSRAGTRKLLLLAVALCRRIWDYLSDDDCRRAVEATERLADHPGVDGDDYAIAAETDAITERLQAGHVGVQDAALGAYLAATACGGMWHDPDGLIEAVAEAAAIAAAGAEEGPAWEAERRAQAELLRELFGNPFRPVALDPAWLTPDVVRLAGGIYEERAFDRLPVLADALQEAGCDHPDVLAHCRAGGPHTRGCWVVDRLLGWGVPGG